MCCFALECIQFVVFCLNIGFIISGIILFILGITVSLISGTVAILVPTYSYTFVAIFLIIAAIFIILIGIAGCYGALKTEECTLIWYYILVTIVVCLEVSALVMAWVGLGGHHDLNEYVLVHSKLRLKDYGKDTKQTFTEAWDNLQKEGECCGVGNKTDWYLFGTFERKKAPDSCCASYFNGCQTVMGRKTWNKSCSTKLLSYAYRRLVWIGIIVFIFIIFKIVLLLFVLILIYMIRYRKNKNTCCGMYVQVD